ncbi:MAG: ASKHA domain-containing protein [Desulfatibacillaceae bacterium]
MAAGSGDGPGWVCTVAPPEASLSDNRGFVDRVTAPLSREYGDRDIRVSLSTARGLPGLFAGGPVPLRCTLFHDGAGLRLVEVAESADAAPCLGLAVDLGTTRIVLRLVDLSTGRHLGEQSFENPQCVVGPDIIVRVHHADTAGALEDLSRMVVEGINVQAGAMCSEAGVSRERILCAAVAGNTTMGHLFLGLSPHSIIREPYLPVANRPGVVSARELGLAFHPEAGVYVFPNIGSYFGGDLIAGILASGLHKGEEPRILVDVGTNAEVALGCRDWLIACAGAAGPALEGGVTRMGMVAGPGAIDRVRIGPATGEIRAHAIGDAPPVGICGSGVIDLAAELFLSGMLDLRGKFVEERCRDRLVEKNGVAAMVVVPAEHSGTGEDLVISQTDIDSLVRSKAAMYSILRTITNTVGVDFGALAAFYVAGTFGAFIDPASAIAIGMLPDLPPERYVPLGNTSLEGATLALASAAAIDEAEDVRNRITYMELNVNQEFMARFSAARFFPHTEPSRFPSVAKWLEERAAVAGR